MPIKNLIDDLIATLRVERSHVDVDDYEFVFKGALFHASEIANLDAGFETAFDNAVDYLLDVVGKNSSDDYLKKSKIFFETTRSMTSNIYYDIGYNAAFDVVTHRLMDIIDNYRLRLLG
jgi:hypothetical protein